MRKIIEKPLVGIVLVILGSGLGGFYFFNIADTSALFLILGITFTGPGIFSVSQPVMRKLSKFSGIDTSIPEKDLQTDLGNENAGTKISEQQAKVDEWAKTMKTRDELKMLQVQADAQKGPSA